MGSTTSLTNVSIYDFCVVPAGTTTCPETGLGWIWCENHPVAPAPAPDSNSTKNSTSIEPEHYPTSRPGGLGAWSSILQGSCATPPCKVVGTCVPCLGCTVTAFSLLRSRVDFRDCAPSSLLVIAHVDVIGAPPPPSSAIVQGRDPLCSDLP